MRRLNYVILLCLVALLTLVGGTNSRAQTAGKKPLASLRSEIGKEPYSMLRAQPLRGRLTALLGPAEYRNLLANMNPARPVGEEDGVLHFEGNAPHRGGEEEAVVLVDVENDTIEVFMRHRETEVRAWAEGNRMVKIPQESMEMMKNWPPRALSQALTGLMQTSRPASASSRMPASAPVSSNPASIAPATSPQQPGYVADACAGAPRCYSSGPFVATIAQVSGSRLADNTKDHMLRLDIRFRNISDRPIILAYAATTSTAIDNLGNNYYWGRAGTHDTSSQGIGLVESHRADPRFVLAPGETRNAIFNLRRFRSGQSQIGTSYTYNVTIQQLEILPGQQVRAVREYSVSFPDVTASNVPPVGDTVRRIGDLFRKH
ncbi:MAG: hypothetical protein JSS87_00225 [Acidobacteria bacterium]|nr:hypothetical protein [Acidobacteriota bacterium]